ncbi:UNVERIFIED_CONTAM: hypothetical protein Sangu_0563500 [Sesamum angustifolium]|uniref:SHSP domain-containing protein n=1 Tax=Sesamum angustifolium TaxID=2727405 RepID=A0AAW2QA13_9LAMI
MATTAGGRRRLDRQNSSLMFRQITPPHGWKEDSGFHYLRLTLPGFEAKDITIHMNKYGHLVVRGDKQVTEHKYITFEETFEVPNNADLEEANGMFEDGHIYCVTIPKKQQVQRNNAEHAITIANEENNPKPQGNKDGSFHKYESTNKPDGLLPQQHGRISASHGSVTYFLAIRHGSWPWRPKRRLEKQWFGAGIFYEGSEELDVDVFKKLEKRKVLSTVEKAGLLSKAEELGVTLSSIEKLGLLSKAEELGLLSLLEKTAGVSPSALASAALPILVAAVVAVVVIPDDSAVLVAAQAVIGGLLAVGVWGCLLVHLFWAGCKRLIKTTTMLP